MIEAIIKYKTGETITVHANSFVELFTAGIWEDVEQVDAYMIGVEDLRQGRGQYITPERGNVK